MIQMCSQTLRRFLEEKPAKRGGLPVHNYQLACRVGCTAVLVGAGVANVQTLHMEASKRLTNIRVVVDAHHHPALAAPHKVGHGQVLLEREGNAVALGLPVRLVHVMEGVRRSYRSTHSSHARFSTYTPANRCQATERVSSMRRMFGAAPVVAVPKVWPDTLLPNAWRELRAHLNCRTNSSRWFWMTRYSDTRLPLISFSTSTGAGCTRSIGALGSHTHIPRSLATRTTHTQKGTYLFTGLLPADSGRSLRLLTASNVARCPPVNVPTRQPHQSR